MLSPSESLFVWSVSRILGGTDYVVRKEPVGIWQDGILVGRSLPKCGSFFEGYALIRAWACDDFFTVFIRAREQNG